MKDFIVIHIDKMKKETFDIIENNNMSDLVLFTKEKNMKSKNVKSIHDIYNKKMISFEIKLVLFLHYDDAIDAIGKIIEIVQKKLQRKTSNLL